MKPASSFFEMTRVGTAWTTSYSLGRLHCIQVQALVRKGIPRLDIIGLPQNMIREGRDRVTSALNLLGIELPQQKLLVSLSPSDLPKEGAHFDLPILQAILVALGIKFPSEKKIFFWGEIELSGVISMQDDPLPHLLHANRQECEALVCAHASRELSFLKPCLHCHYEEWSHIEESFHPLKKLSDRERNTAEFTHEKLQSLWLQHQPQDSRWASLRGRPFQFLLWALVVLARQHLLIEGSPGVGKSYWCRAIREILLPLPIRRWHERFEFQSSASSHIHSLSELMQAPFENPHHSSSVAALVGGGSASIEAGALTRAHRGVLFLDEIAEFSQMVLESLREPLENQCVQVARRGVTQNLPASIQLLGTMNPCKCGNYKSSRLCRCSTSRFWNYQNKLSEPLRDRFAWKVWWNYYNEAKPKDFELKPLKQNLLRASTRPNPKLKELSLPKFHSARKQRIWLESFFTWCRWFDIERPGSKALSQFNSFLEEISQEVPDHES